MTDKRDYYEALGVSRNVGQDELRTAYRKLAKQYHPDVNQDPSAEDRFKEINEAYAVLSDPQRRAAYDRYGHAGVKGMPTDFGVGFSDIFEEFFGFGFGGRGRRNAPRRGTDLRYNLQIEFEEAVFGAEKEIQFSRQDRCPECKGAGAEPGTSPIRCSNCNGSGEVRQVRQTFIGSMVNVSTCPTCGGRGEVVSSPCRNCSGTGITRKEITKVVDIPAGVDDGTQIRISGEGEPGLNGGPQGDLYVAINVKKHPYFRRQGDDILLDLSINIAQASLGAVVEVPTVDGTEEIDIPPGTQPGKVIRLRGKGVPHLRRNGRGDQLVIISVEIPRNLDPDQRELIEQLAPSLGTETITRERSFLDSIKELFGGLAD